MQEWLSHGATWSQCRLLRQVPPLFQAFCALKFVSSIVPDLIYDSGDHLDGLLYFMVTKNNEVISGPEVAFPHKSFSEEE
jgi:hypothetical protein